MDRRSQITDTTDTNAFSQSQMLDDLTRTLKEMHAFQEQTSGLLHHVLDEQCSRARLDMLKGLVMGPPPLPLPPPAKGYALLQGEAQPFGGHKDNRGKLSDGKSVGEGKGKLTGT